ncbi:tyrosine-type recombinase/integrase [Catenulispora yoronensis]|uniref:Tyrosine-type recombinase/integrase n=1 Tax=Catenulispora yoronensis TaxID=450799 RepID=A0ABN2TUV9_9ACTN
MAKSPVFKKCGCRGPVLDAAGRPKLDAVGRPVLRRLGSGCPQLRTGSRWNPKHGSWHFQIEVMMGVGQPRQHLTQGGIASSGEAEQAVDAIRALVAVPDELEDAPEAAANLRLEIVGRIRKSLKDKAPLPELEEIRKAAKLGQPVLHKLTVGEWLTEWIGAKGRISKNTVRGYQIHIEKYLIPHLGRIPLDRLRVAHVHAMIAVIADDAETIPVENAARRDMETAVKVARRSGDRETARELREKLASMPPYRKPANAATRQRIRATLRTALTAACAQQLITVNVAALAELESGKRPKALVWTPERVERWRRTGEVPSPVMVWTAEQTGAFLQRAAGHECFALFHLIAFTGLRRGEAVGLRWVDVDLGANTLHVTRQIVQIDWETFITPPKSEAGERDVAVDDRTVAILRTHRKEQAKARLAAGEDWVDSGLVFTGPDGAELHPGWVSAQFRLLLREAGLPPVRLHDLRHGAATLALAAGIDIKVVQEMLGHSSSTITRDTYTSVFDELKHAAAGAIANAITAATPPAA